MSTVTGEPKEDKQLTADPALIFSKNPSIRFPTAPARLTCVAGRLAGKAYQLTLPKIAYGLPQFPDYPDVLAYLEAAFGGPDRAQNAQNKLYQLKQKNDDFSTYFSDLQRLGEGLVYDDMNFQHGFRTRACSEKGER